MVYKTLFAIAFLGTLFAIGCGSGSGSAPPPGPTITSVGVSCALASIQTGQTSQCSATVTGTGNYSSTVTWSAVSGTISSSGLYTAPATVPASGSDTIKATSTQDSSKSGTATVAVTPPTITSVGVSCAPTSVQTGQTSQCSTTVTGTANYSSTVTWSAVSGTISGSGLYTAPPTVPASGSDTIKATSIQDSTKSGTATVTVTPPPTITSVSVSCTPMTVLENQTSLCSATVQGTGNFDPTVTWAAGLGTIVPTTKDAATYTAPSSATGPDTVKATSSQDASKSGTAALIVSIPPPSNAFQVVGPPGAAFSALAADPSSPGTVYASTNGFGASGQFLKSTDFAKTWQAIGQSLVTDNEIVTIAVSPVSGTVYAGGINSNVIFKSTDRGTTWSQIVPGAESSISVLSVDPSSDSTIYALTYATSGNVLDVSKDGGADWSSYSTPCSGYLAADPMTEGTLYCTAGSAFLVSTNGGATWTTKSQIAGMNLGTFAIATTNPKRIDLIAGPTASYDVAFLYSSSDGGGTWTEITSAGDVESVLVDVTNPLGLYAGTPTGFESSGDGGNTWTKSVTAPAAFGLLVQIPGVPTTLIEDSDTDLWSSQDHGATWVEADKGISDHWGYQVAVDRQNPRTIYLAATDRGGIYKSVDGANTWTRNYSDNCNAVSVDPFNSSHLLAGCLANTLLESNDGGITWQNVSLTFVGSGVFEITLVAFDPNLKGTVYLGIIAVGGPAVAKSSDGGASWSLIDNGLPPPSTTSNNVGNVYSFAISPSDSNVLLVCIVGAYGGIYKSIDSGATWTLTAPVIATSLAFDSNHKGNVYAAGAVFIKSADNGGSWSNIPIPASGFDGLDGPLQIIVDPKSADTLFMVPSAGPPGWSPDGGNTWFPLSDGLTSDVLLGSNFGFVSAIAGTSPEVLYIPSSNRGLVSMVLQH